MKTLTELEEALDDALAATTYKKVVAPDISITSYKFSGDGIGFGTLGDAITIGYIVADGRNDHIISGGGNDTIKGYGGSDVLVGGGGNDNIFGGPGSFASTFTVDGTNFIFGDSQVVDPTFSLTTDGNDLLAGGIGSINYIFGGGGNDTIYGSNFANAPGAGADYLSGGPGDDLIIGGDGNNTIDGGPGNDIAAFRGVLTLSGQAISSYSIRPSYKAVGEFSVVGPDGTDLVSNVEQLEMKPASSTTATASPSFDMTSTTYSLPTASFTIVIHRYANGSGYLQAFKDGDLDASGARNVYLSVGSATTMLGGMLLSTVNPRLMNMKSYAPQFAYDDLTPVAAGTYGAVLRTDTDLGVVTSKNTTSGGTTDLYLQNVTAASGPNRTAIEIHVGNFTKNSEGCYVLGSANLGLLLGPIVEAAASIPEQANTSSASAILAAVGLNFPAGIDDVPSFLPTANADITGTSSASSPAWQSSIQVQIEDAIAQPTIAFGQLRDLGVVGGLHRYGVDLNLSRAVSKDIRVIVSLTGPGTLDPGPVLIQGGSPRGEVRFSVAVGSAGATTAVTLSIQPSGVRPAQAVSTSASSVSPSGSSTYADLATVFKLFGGAHTTNYVLGSAVATTGPIVTPTGYGGESYILLTPADANAVVATTGFDTVTTAFSNDGGGVPQSVTLPSGIEEVAASGSAPLLLTAKPDAMALTGGNGDDTLVAVTGAVLTGGGGANIFEGQLAALNAVEITDYTAADQIVILGAAFDASAVTVTEGSTNITIDVNHDGTSDAAFKLDVSLAALTAAGLHLVVEPVAAGTRLAFEPACYCAGTLILTDQGERAVEALSIGDRVMTLDGSAQPIRWIGRRRIEVARHPEPVSIWPILVCEGTFAERVPSRDLWLSPGHNIMVGQSLVPISALQNGRTIRQIPRPVVEYWHVELENHDIILAEGLPAETYLDTGNRCAFVNGGIFVEQHPDFQPRHWAETCLPLVFSGTVVQQAKTALLCRAGILGEVMVAEDDLHIVADGLRVNPVRLSQTRVAFLFSEVHSTICLRSRCFIPAYIDPTSEDRRTLGVCVGRLQLDGADVELDDANVFADGWHGVETYPGHKHRWTTGAAVLPAGTRLVILDQAERGFYWLERATDVVRLFG